MAGIEDIIEIYRGEPIFKNRSTFKDSVGKFVTDKADEAAIYARKFPSVIKSTKVPRETFVKFKDAFEEKFFKQPKYPTNSGYFYGLIDDPNKLKVDIIKTLGVNIKNLTPLAIKGLSMLSSLPAATIAGVLQSTPANEDEVNMTLEDFAKLSEGDTNIDKSLSVKAGEM